MLGFVLVHVPILSHALKYPALTGAIDSEAAETLVAITPARANINAKPDKIILVIFMIDKCLEFYNK